MGEEDYPEFVFDASYEEAGSHHVDPPEWHEEPRELGDWDDPDQDYPPVADESEYTEPLVDPPGWYPGMLRDEDEYREGI